MAVFVLGILLFLVAVGLLLYRRSIVRTAKLHDGNTAESVGYAIGGWACLAVSVLFVLLSMAQEVGTKEVGVLTAYGATDGHIGPGLNLEAPWDSVTTLDAAIQTDRFYGDQCLTIRIANQQNMCAYVGIKWRINTNAGNPDYLFQNYHDFANIRESLVTQELITALNEQFADYNPLNSIQYTTATGATSGPAANLPPAFPELARRVLAQMQRELAGKIVVLAVFLPYAKYDDKTQARLSQLQEQFALTRVAQAKKQTNIAQNAANQALASSVNKSPNVLVSECMDVLAEMVKNGQTPPAGFSCWPGGGLTGVIANASGR